MTFEETNTTGNTKAFGLVTCKKSICDTCTHNPVCIAKPDSFAVECRFYEEGTVDYSKVKEEPVAIPRHSIDKYELRDKVAKLIDEGFHFRFYRNEWEYFDIDSDTVGYLSRCHQKGKKYLGVMAWDVWDRDRGVYLNDMPLRSDKELEKFVKGMDKSIRHYSFPERITLLPFEIDTKSFRAVWLD